MASRSSSDHPRVNAPLPRRPIPLDEFNRAVRVGGKLSSVDFSRPPCAKGLLPLPEGARQSSSSPPTTVCRRSPIRPLDLPHPVSTPHYRDNGRGFDVGRDIRVTAPPTHDHTWDADPPAPSAPVSPSEFWDNITIPLSAYIPAPRDGSPEHRTPSPSLTLHAAPRSAQCLGIDQPRPGSRHSSLYQSRNPLPVAQPSQSQMTVATGQTSSSSVSHHADPDYTVDIGGQIDRQLTAEAHDLHRSYSRPLSRDTMSTSPMRPAERAPSRSSLNPPTPFPDTTPPPQWKVRLSLDL